jgi:hypothetical protein
MIDEDAFKLKDAGPEYKGQGNSFMIALLAVFNKRKGSFEEDIKAKKARTGGKDEKDSTDNGNNGAGRGIPVGPPAGQRI